MTARRKTTPYKRKVTPAWVWFSLLLAAAALFNFAAGLAVTHQLAGPELSIFRSVNNWPDTWRWPFLAITQAGSAWMLYGLTLLLIWLKKARLALKVFVLGAATYLLTELAKELIRRQRPALLLNGVHQREAIAPGFGFPSGHTALATVMSLTLVMALPRRWRWLAVVWIGLVALSRIYLGVHAPLDVVGGFAVGAGVVCAGQLLLRTKEVHAFVKRLRVR